MKSVKLIKNSTLIECFEDGRIINAETNEQFKAYLVGGYPTVSINRKLIKVHRIVAECFIDNHMNKPCVNHINGNKQDNSISNLEWVTISENNSHAYRTGLKPPVRTYLRRKPIEQFSKEGLFISRFDNIEIAATRTKVNRGNIISCLKGRLKTAGSFIWKYS